MTEFLRRPNHHYQDPLSQVWINCAAQIGFRIRRTTQAYASTDGKGTVLIATDGMFDPDDCLAQMIFHELCHALVEGEVGETKEDWGLGYRVGADPWREHACLRLQAYLADSVGLRDFFAPTTDFRVSFWESLPANPFFSPPDLGGRRERSCVAARLGAWRAATPRWLPLQAALGASRKIAEALASSSLPPADGHANPAIDPGVGDLPLLWSTVRQVPEPHPTGHSTLADYFEGRTCADCAWGFTGRKSLRCRHAPERRLPAETPACRRYEPAEELACSTCGACCREAYQSVELSSREVLNRLHPEMVVVEETHRKLKRSGVRCAALAGGITPYESYHCAIYELRPRTCREFALGGANCLDARRRVGLSL